MIRWTDQHVHLDPETADEAMAECREAGVLRLIDVGTDVESSEQAITLAERFDEVWATAGVHPHDAQGGIEGLESLLGHERVVGVGECGLDYHYDHSPREVQRTVFAHQIALAHQHDLALVIHTREAWDDTFDILRSEGVPDRTVMHCFTGGPDEARACLDLGAHLSFSGIVTFPSAPDLRAAAVLCPADRLLVETDAPYLAPVPHRGRTNRPALVAVVGASVAATRGVDVEVVAADTWRNAELLYALPTN